MQYAAKYAYVGKCATRGGCETHPLLNMEWFPRCLSIKYSLSYSVFVSMSKKERRLKRCPVLSSLSSLDSLIGKHVNITCFTKTNAKSLLSQLYVV